jgi:ADP-ribose pyrophosphatase
MIIEDAQKMGLEIIDRQILYEGFNRLHLLTYRHHRYDGSWSEILSREVFQRRDAACILPYDPVLDRVAMVEQIRPGSIVAGHLSRQLEPVAGMIDPGEDPLDTALREAVEEADCRIERSEKICSILVSPSSSTENVHCFCGRADLSGAGGLGGCAHEDEDILVRLLSFSEVREGLAQFRFCNSVAVICLQWLVIHHDRLIASWR